MKESYRLQKNILAENLKISTQSLSLFIIYTGNELPNYAAIHDKMGHVITRLVHFANETSATNT